MSVATKEELELCFDLRIEVFVEGQGVARELELDGLDAEAIHFLARIDGEPVGTARLRNVDGYAKVERVAVREAHREAGVGRALMESVEAEARAQGRREARLNAQVTALRFYERQGYVAYGPEFLDAEMPHRHMRKEIGSP